MNCQTPPPPQRAFCAFWLPVILLLIAGAAACNPRPSVPTPADPPVTLHGNTGRTITQQIALPSPYSRITWRYQGQGNFIVKAYYQEIGYDFFVEDTLVNAIGEYAGVVFVASEEPVLIDVLADAGHWDARIEAIGEAGYMTNWEGTGDWVSDFFDPPPDSVWQIAHAGESNFSVQALCLENAPRLSEQLVVNEIGAYTGIVAITFDGAPCLWVVSADGDWSIRLQE
jgi:hypothetical protein